MEFYGKRLQTIIEADNEFRAEQKVRARLKLQIEEMKEEKVKDEGVEFLKNMFGMT